MTAGSLGATPLTLNGTLDSSLRHDGRLEAERTDDIFVHLKVIAAILGEDVRFAVGRIQLENPCRRHDA